MTQHPTSSPSSSIAKKIQRCGIVVFQGR